MIIIASTVVRPRAFLAIACTVSISAWVQANRYIPALIGEPSGSASPACCGSEGAAGLSPEAEPDGEWCHP